MNDTTNQMSLLDAIGFDAPEVEKAPDPAATQKAEKKEAKRRKKKVSQEPARPEAGDAAAGGGSNTAEEMPAPAEPAPEETENPDGAALDITPGGALPLEQFLCFGLYSANHAMHGVYKNLLKEVGLTYPQFLAMTVLWEKNNVPVGAVTSKLQLDTNTLTPLLKRLEAMGFLTRTRSPKDERQVILKLTRKGRNLQKKTEHFAGCIFEATGMKASEIADLQARIMTLRDKLREAGQN